MTIRVWVLGAPDPEMQLIEDLLAEADEQVAYALDATGQRVHPGTAYRAASLSLPVPEGAAVYAVECGGPAIPAGAVVIDHHRPGDPGYGRPPAEFLPASSIGQVISWLAAHDALPESWRRCGIHPDDPTYWGRAGEVSIATFKHAPPCYYAIGAAYDYLIPADHVLAAAADHCLAAAYRGECPGVDPDELMRWRVEIRAAHQGRNVEEILADVERAREALLAAPSLALSWGCSRCAYTGIGDEIDAEYDGWCDCALRVLDLRGTVVAELPEAAAREGVAYLATVADRDGREKVVLGAADAEHVRAFLERWAPAQGLVDLYGDPARGFAGGYVAAIAA